MQGLHLAMAHIQGLDVDHQAQQQHAEDRRDADLHREAADDQRAQIDHADEQHLGFDRHIPQSGARTGCRRQQVWQQAAQGMHGRSAPLASTLGAALQRIA